MKGGDDMRDGEGVAIWTRLLRYRGARVWMALKVYRRILKELTALTEADMNCRVDEE